MNFKRKHPKTQVGGCQNFCKPHKAGRVPKREEAKPSDRRRMEGMSL